ncbi:MAG: cytochrome c oxidase subunit 3 [Candidatus Nitrosoglobus sp.]|jgi:cytochrome c oxidase subunit 3
MINDRTLTAEQFDDPGQEHEASVQGMWVFLSTEVLFFGVLFASYVVSRFNHPEAFAAASNQTDIVIGTINTGILLTSSLTMANAVRSARLGNDKLTIGFLILTFTLGAVFLILKGIEYHEDYEHHLVPGLNLLHKGPQEIFFYLYFLMTGLHTLHLTLGLLTIIVITGMAWRKRFSVRYFTPVELTGLYWSFVDIVWVFLYPTLYLISRGT